MNQRNFIILGAFVAILLGFLAFFCQNIDYGELLSVNIGVQTTVVVTTFSFILVTVQLASVQFSPRILRLFFSKDSKIRLVLGLFLTDIVFCFLLKIFGFKTEEYKILPLIGIFFGLFLIGVILPLFFSYILNALNVGNISFKIANNVLQNIDKKYDKSLVNIRNLPDDLKNLPQKNLKANSMGFLNRIDYQVISNLANKYPDAIIYCNQDIGTFIQPQENLISFCTKNNEKLCEKDEKTLKNAFEIGKYRSIENDINYGVRQLVDIAIKAISPAVNDPTTAINCLNYLGVIVQQAGNQTFPSIAVKKLPKNVFIKETDYKHLVNHAFDQIHFWGKNDPIVMKALRNCISQCVQNVDNQENRVVLTEKMSSF